MIRKTRLESCSVLVGCITLGEAFVLSVYFFGERMGRVNRPMSSNTSNQRGSLLSVDILCDTNAPCTFHISSFFSASELVVLCSHPFSPPALCRLLLQNQRKERPRSFPRPHCPLLLPLHWLPVAQLHLLPEWLKSTVSGLYDPLVNTGKINEISTPEGEEHWCGCYW